MRERGSKRREKEKKDERAKEGACGLDPSLFLSPRHWHGAIRPSVSESKQMRQKMICCGGCCCCCCCEEAEAGSARLPPAATTLGLRASSDEVDDSAPTTFRAEAGADEQRMEAVPAVVVVGAVSPAAPGGSGGRDGGSLSIWREKATKENRCFFFLFFLPPVETCESALP